MTLQDRIVQELLRLGIPANLKGFDYLRRAVEIMVENGNYTQSLYKFVLPTLSKEIGVRVISIVKTITFAVDKSMNQPEMIKILETQKDTSARCYISRIVSYVARNVEPYAQQLDSSSMRIVDEATIGPEELSIVKELRDKLARYEQAKKDGRLIELPCKIGEKVFAIYTGNTGKHPTVFRVSFEYGMIPYFGKTVFLTKEEAEAALKERETE